MTSRKELKLGVIEDILCCPEIIVMIEADLSGYEEQV